MTPRSVGSSSHQSLLDDIERVSGKQFQYRSEIEFLMSVAHLRSMETLFSELTFYAKFITSAFTLLQRAGIGSEEVRKVATEFEVTIEKASTLTKTLVKESSDPMKHEFTTRFLSQPPAGLSSFVSLMRELSWIKNYTLDAGRP